MIGKNLLWIAFLFPILGWTQAPAWKINPKESTITFLAVQNDVPFKGKFTQFDGDIRFHPEQLADSNVVLKIDTTSLNTPLKEVTELLKGPDWLNIQKFPQARFETQSIHKKDPQHYEAHGKLTLRDKTAPMKIDFTLTENTPQKILLKGTTTIRRTQWGLGQGEWADPKTVRDDVQIDFTFDLEPTS